MTKPISGETQQRAAGLRLLLSAPTRSSAPLRNFKAQRSRFPPDGLLKQVQLEGAIRNYREVRLGLD